jgi:oligopeptide transport system substrate-binding protein
MRDLFVDTHLTDANILPSSLAHRGSPVVLPQPHSAADDWHIECPPVPGSDVARERTIEALVRERLPDLCAGIPIVECASLQGDLDVGPICDRSNRLGLSRSRDERDFPELARALGESQGDAVTLGGAVQVESERTRGAAEIGCNLGFEICYIIENSSDVLQCQPDTLFSYLPTKVTFASFSLERTVFSISSLHGRSFVFCSMRVFPEDLTSTRSFLEQWPIFKQLLTFSLKVPGFCRQLATVKTICSVAPSLGQELLRWYRYRMPPQEAILDELQRFLLATDKEFKNIRTASHLLKLVRTHLWLKHNHHALNSPLGPRVRLFYRLFRSKLQFPFGAKDVLSVVISLHSLSSYERFDHKHILLACTRCVPSLTIVPGSFYVYRYSEESTLSLYLEVEKEDGSFPTMSEIALLKKELGREFESSIEQVMSRIDIPQNEEDILRNLLLLSQQCRTTKDLPQVVIQFQGQTDLSLDFQIAVVRGVRKGQEGVPVPPPDPSGILKCIPLRSSILDKLRTRHVKQGLVLLVHCSKKEFLRNDQSVNFLKARSAVAAYLESFLGKIRDVNGGLIYQQHQLLKSMQPLLAQDEMKEIAHVEDLFHSLAPAIMKNLLSPEHMVTVFRQFLALRNALSTDGETFLVEKYAKELFLGFVCPSSLVPEEIFQAQVQFQMAEHEVALCSISSDGRQLCFVVCLSQNEEMKQQFCRWLQERVQEKKKARKPQTLRISLPRPTLALDPRIGTDRTSGTVIKMLYEGLMRLDLNGQPTHAIAEEVLVSDDGKTYTFKLRSSFWTNGQPVTAHDFEYAWKKILEPSFHTVFDYLLHPILNAQRVKAGELPPEALGIHAVRDHELVVELEKPTPYFLELCCLWIYSPLCKNLDKTRPGWAYYGDHTYVCNGPFKLKHWSRNGGIVVVKNERYWDRDKVSLEEIDISIIENPLVALELFEQGELDWLGEPISETPLCLFQQKRPDIHMQPMSAVQWYVLNVQRPPFCSAKVRRAFSYAIDRLAIIKNVLYGDERPASSVLPASLSLLGDQQSLFYDPQEAKRLFAEGLEEQGLTPAMLKPIHLVCYDQEPHKSIARTVIQSWKDIFGICVVLDVVGWHEFFEKLGGVNDIIAPVWYSWYQDPMYSLAIFKSASSTINASKWSDDRLVALLNRAEDTKEREERSFLLRETERIVMQEMPIIPIVDYNSRYLKNEALENIYVSYLGNVDFKWASVNHPLVAPPMSADEIHLYLQTDPLSLDPRIGGERRNQMVLRELYEGLLRMGKDGRVERALAESFSVTDEGKKYTFRLRPSRWSNGMPVTAEDFAWTIKSVLNPSFPSLYAYAFFSIKNAIQARRGAVSVNDIGVRTLDELTLEICLEHSVSYFPELLANSIYAPVCKAVAEENPRWATEVFPRYVSNGPYVLMGHAPKSQILLAKNPYYWNIDAAKSERISFRIIKDPQTAFTMFEAGELDWYGEPCGSMSPLGFASLQHRGLLRQVQDSGTAWLVCQTGQPHLQSKNIRKALSSAINRKEICETLLQGGESPALTLLPRALSSLSTPPIEDYCPDVALSCFEQGLADLGLSRESFPPLVISHWSDPRVKGMVKVIQYQLQVVLGIRVETLLLEWPTYIKRLVTGEYQLALMRWFTWCDDPAYTLQYAKYRNYGINGTGFEDPDYIRLLEQSDAAMDDSSRREFLRQAEALIMKELPIIPLWYWPDTYAKGTNVHGEAFSSVGSIELMWMEKHGEQQ